MSNSLRIATILGTRPEIIRLSRLIPTMDSFFDHTLIHTGQNQHPKLSQVFFKELELRQPDFHFKTDTSSLGSSLSSILVKTEETLIEVKPDAVVILGDTNSALAALIAARMQIPVFHLEAGNRAFDKRVPEEINRKLVDHISSYNLPYSEAARLNLIREGIHPATILKTGSPLPEVFEFYKERIESSKALSSFNVAPQEYFLASLHRQENVEDPSTLENCISALEDLSKEFDLPTLVSVHPRTQKKLAPLNKSIDKRVRLLEPLGFFDYVRLQVASKSVISDSGSISEEASILGFRAVTMRNSMERPEALEAAVIAQSGLTSSGLLEAVRIQLEGMASPVDDYKHLNFSSRVTNFISAKLRSA